MFGMFGVYGLMHLCIIQYIAIPFYLHLCAMSSHKIYSSFALNVYSGSVRPSRTFSSPPTWFDSLRFDGERELLSLLSIRLRSFVRPFVSQSVSVLSWLLRMRGPRTHKHMPWSILTRSDRLCYFGVTKSTFKKSLGFRWPQSMLMDFNPRSLTVLRFERLKENKTMFSKNPQIYEILGFGNNFCDFQDIIAIFFCKIFSPKHTLSHIKRNCAQTLHL